jgi:hypothetical protein
MPRMRRRPTSPHMPKTIPDATLFSRKAFLDEALVFPTARVLVCWEALLVTVLLSITSSVDVVWGCCWPVLLVLAVSVGVCGVEVVDDVSAGFVSVEVADVWEVVLAVLDSSAEVVVVDPVVSAGSLLVVVEAAGRVAVVLVGRPKISVNPGSPALRVVVASGSSDESCLRKWRPKTIRSIWGESIEDEVGAINERW